MSIMKNVRINNKITRTYIRKHSHSSMEYKLRHPPLHLPLAFSRCEAIYECSTKASLSSSWWRRESNLYRPMLKALQRKK
ncbi:hypothetical protein PanWU01x14_123920, partial [Parasponia andersonii]